MIVSKVSTGEVSCPFYPPLISKLLFKSGETNKQFCLWPNSLQKRKASETIRGGEEDASSLHESRMFSCLSASVGLAHTVRIYLSGSKAGCFVTQWVLQDARVKNLKHRFMTKPPFQLSGLRDSLRRFSRRCRNPRNFRGVCGGDAWGE